MYSVSAMSNWGRTTEEYYCEHSGFTHTVNSRVKPAPHPHFFLQIREWAFSIPPEVFQLTGGRAGLRTLFQLHANQLGGSTDKLESTGHCWSATLKGFLQTEDEFCCNDAFSVYNEHRTDSDEKHTHTQHTPIRNTAEEGQCIHCTVYSFYDLSATGMFRVNFYQEFTNAEITFQFKFYLFR